MPAAHRFRLIAHRLGKLMLPQEYQTLTALPRIQPRPPADWQPKQRLVDLEQARMTACMLPRERWPAALRSDAGAMERDEACWSWQYPQAALTGVLPQQQPFREDPQRKVTLAFLPDEDEENLVLHRVEDDRARRGQSLYIAIERSQRHSVPLTPGERIGPWGEFDLMALLNEQAQYLDLPLQVCARRLATVEVADSEQGWRYHPWLGLERQK